MESLINDAARLDLQKELRKQDQTTATALAVGMILVLVAAMSLSDNQLVSPAISAGMMLLSCALGVLILAVKIEGAVRSHVNHSYGVRYACLFAVAFLAYLARLNGLSDLNKIFHIDPSALPLTMWVATIVNLMKLLAPLITFGFVFAIIAWGFHAKMSDHATEGASWIWLVCAFACAILWGVGSFRLGDEPRRQLLYRVALDSDFVSSFQCDGLDATGLAGLFIGPEQRRALLAPTLKDSELLLPKTPTIFKPVKIPESFPIIDCVAPRVDMKQWRHEHALDPMPLPIQTQ